MRLKQTMKIGDPNWRSRVVVALGEVLSPQHRKLLLPLFQVVGELSLLDAEPRSASVFAIERSHLFHLAQSDFYSLFSERPEIAQVINRVLCQMVRKANAA